MGRLYAVMMVSAFLLISRGEKGGNPYIPRPAVKVRVTSVGMNDAEVEIKSINAEKTMYLCLEVGQTEGIEAEEVVSAGVEVPSERFTIYGLDDATEYHLLVAAADRDGNLSSMQRDTLFTLNDPSDDGPSDKGQDENGLYWWERDRAVIPGFADMALCYGGHSARNPQVWTKDRFGKTALYTDTDGNIHWLFDAMLMLEIWDDNYTVTYSLANDGKDSSRKSHWLSLADYWFDGHDGLQALDDCIADAVPVLGPPPSPRYVIFTLPDPVYFENYSDAVGGGGGNTVYWGSIDGVEMDFSNMEHRFRAYRWYIDHIRARFAAKDFKHIRLLGFYILSETLAMKGGWRYEYKRHEELIPQVADYCHSCNEGLYWIPYSVSDSDVGHNKALQNWQSFGFDLAVLQPNYYWEDKSWGVTCRYINDYDMGMELEFEGSHGEPLGSSILSRLSDGSSNPHAETNKARFSEYMTNARNYGIYGTRPLVLYTGTNALYELAVSEDEADRKLYHSLGRFIIDSLLKKY